jgi:hypothetical protein
MVAKNLAELRKGAATKAKVEEQPTRLRRFAEAVSKDDRQVISLNVNLER